MVSVDTKWDNKIEHVRWTTVFITDSQCLLQVLLPAKSGID